VDGRTDGRTYGQLLEVDLIIIIIMIFVINICENILCIHFLCFLMLISILCMGNSCIRRNTHSLVGQPSGDGIVEPCPTNFKTSSFDKP